MYSSATEAILRQRGLLAAALNPNPSRHERRLIKQAKHDAKRLDLKHRKGLDKGRNTP